MNRKHLQCVAIAAVLMAGAFAPPAAAQQAAVDADDIGGVVTGPNGPEAGVWVIAETTDLPTRYIKSVVTDDQGRYLGSSRGFRALSPPARLAVQGGGHGADT